ncbi:Mak10 subunit, NatC N-terminal acetyltransferase-domain-containing protein [Sordaria brevicollis]|uniref:Mak10 subunit, NatC N-terminal acetyltransferase-domain-containing protein n=1 Tax=Sordaria brevicollis TaxID=83679 RepID=A0AAE0U6C4_SORBR|nr:Mak10 subunit, NatC N-terminal acetyltransferase-domain-containing protein [Sordaria brevicollis]
MSNPGIIATDITKKFLSACKTLETGEIVKDGYFTLFEAVGALEIGDPKMDSGCLAPGETLEETYDVNRDLEPAEVLGIIDQLICLEMAWHMGYPLSQTILTSVYIEALVEPMPVTLEDADFVRKRTPWDRYNPRDVMKKVLRAYCLGLVRTCSDVLETIRDELYYEEEDFVTNTYRRSLLEHIDRSEIRNEIAAAKLILHQVRERIGIDLAQALTFRLELRSAFLRALELIEDVRGSPESLQIPWCQMHSIWEGMLKLSGLAKEVPEAFSTKLQRKLASSMPPRPIVTLSFAEAAKHFMKLCNDAIDAVKILDYHDSQSLLNFVFHFQAQKPQPCVYIRCLLQNLIFKDMILLDRLSIRQVMDDDLSIVVMPAHEFLDPINDIVEGMYDYRAAISHQMENFRKRSAQSYIDIFRVLCQNRCRVRRMLCHLIQDWEQVQLEAEHVDQVLQHQVDEEPLDYQAHTTLTHGQEPGYHLPLSSWAYLYKLRLMEWIVQLGFELEVYAPDELAGMYWYLSHLAKTRAQHVERIQAFTNHRLNESRSSRKPPPNTPWIRPSQPHHPPEGWPLGITSSVFPPTHAISPTKEPLPAQSTSFCSPTSAAAYHYDTSAEAAYIRSLTYLRSTILDAAITWEFADTVSVIYTLLSRLGLIKPPPRPYGTDKDRYEVRMKPFKSISVPEVPSFETWKAHSTGTSIMPEHSGPSETEEEETSEQLLSFALQAVSQAKKAFTVLEGLSEREAFAAGGGGFSLPSFDPLHATTTTTPTTPTPSTTTHPPPPPQPLPQPEHNQASKHRTKPPKAGGDTNAG